MILNARSPRLSFESRGPRCVGHVTVTSTSYRPSVAGVRGVARGIARRTAAVVRQVLRLAVDRDLAGLDRRRPHGLRGRCRRRGADRAFRVVEHLRAAVADDSGRALDRADADLVALRPPGVDRRAADDAGEGEDGHDHDGDRDRGRHGAAVEPRHPLLDRLLQAEPGRVVVLSRELDAHPDVGRAERELEPDEPDGQEERQGLLPQLDDGDDERAAVDGAGDEDGDLLDGVAVSPVAGEGRRVRSVDAEVVQEAGQELEKEPRRAEELLSEAPHHAIPHRRDHHQHDHRPPGVVVHDDSGDGCHGEGDQDQRAREEREGHEASELDDASDTSEDHAEDHDDHRDADQDVEGLPRECIHVLGVVPGDVHADDEVRHAEADAGHHVPGDDEGHLRDSTGDASDAGEEVGETFAPAAEPAAGGRGGRGVHDASDGDGDVGQAVFRRVEGVGEAVRDRGAETMALFFGGAALHFRLAPHFFGDVGQRFERLRGGEEESATAALQHAGDPEQERRVVLVDEVVSQPVGDHAREGVIVLVLRDERGDELRNALFGVFAPGEPEAEELPQGEKAGVASGHGLCALGRGI